MLTDLQEERIKQHLDFQRGVTDILSVGFNVNLGTLNDTQLRLIIGTIGTALSADIIEYDGEQLCTRTSVLGRVEQAFAKLDNDTIDATQFVKSAGKVTLNPYEFKLRQQFYEAKVLELAKALGYADGVFDANSLSGPRL